jgi:RNA polymerase sigma-70 factor (TIGR02943 family)
VIRFIFVRSLRLCASSLSDFGRRERKLDRCGQFAADESKVRQAARLRPMPTFEEQLVEHRVYLMRFARLQLRNDAWAEDVVSETLLAALSKPQTFGNRSQLKTWLVGILKHKVIDLIRSNAREVAASDNGDDEADEIDKLAFKADGHFASPPSDWGDPHQTLQQSQFFKVLDACVERLPPGLGRLFLMREWLELSCEEVCKELSLTPTNLYVQLHRARLRLRECLGIHWFGQQAN